MVRRVNRGVGRWLVFGIQGLEVVGNQGALISGKKLIHGDLLARAQLITAITRRGLLVVVVAGSGLVRYTEIALPLDKTF